MPNFPTLDSETERFLLETAVRTKSPDEEVAKMFTDMLKDIFFMSEALINHGMCSLPGHPPVFYYLSKLSTFRQLFMHSEDLIRALSPETLNYHFGPTYAMSPYLANDVGILMDAPRLFCDMKPDLLNAGFAFQLLNTSKGRKLLTDFPEARKNITNATMSEFINSRDYVNSIIPVLKMFPDLCDKVQSISGKLYLFTSEEDLQLLGKHPQWLADITKQDLQRRIRDNDGQNYSTAYALLRREAGRKLVMTNEPLLRRYLEFGLQGGERVINTLNQNKGELIVTTISDYLQHPWCRELQQAINAKLGIVPHVEEAPAAKVTTGSRFLRR